MRLGMVPVESVSVEGMEVRFVRLDWPLRAFVPIVRLAAHWLFVLLALWARVAIAVVDCVPISSVWPGRSGWTW